MCRAKEVRKKSSSTEKAQGWGRKEKTKGVEYVMMTIDVWKRSSRSKKRGCIGAKN
jgi:hypothetical protein